MKLKNVRVYIKVRKGEVDRTEEMVDGELFVDFDAEDNILGYEILVEKGTIRVEENE